MYIDLGNHNIVNKDEIIAIIDIKTQQSSNLNVSFLDRAHKEGKLVYCTDKNFVKSYVVTDGEDRVDSHPVIYATSFTTKSISEKRQLV